MLGPITSFDEYVELPSFVQLTGDTATIVATDATGGPLLTLNQYGQGRAVLLATRTGAFRSTSERSIPRRCSTFFGQP